MELGVQGRTAAVAAASAGLGFATAQALAREGVRVAICGRDQARVEDAAVRIGAEAVPLVMDVGSGEGGRAFVEAATTALGGSPDILVANAGGPPRGGFDDMALDDYRAALELNLLSTIAMCQAALPGMRERGWGRIVNVASVTVYGGWADLYPYVASKAALVGLTRAWAREFGPHGITVNAIAPGAFPTDAEKIHPDPEGYTRFVIDHQAVKRRGRPEDIAEALLFLASDRAGFITGQTLNVDGGWVMQ